MNFAEIFIQGNFVLIAVFLLLLGMSMASWYIIVWKGLILRQQYKIYNDFQKHHTDDDGGPGEDEERVLSGKDYLSLKW